MHDSRHRVDHDEAYRDDPGYTAPEMEPGNGEDVQPAVWVDTIHAGSAAGFGIGVAGAALAGEVIDEQTQDELAATNPRVTATD